MDVIVKNTSELTEKEKRDLLSCFIEVFEHERTMEEMINQYQNTPMGYCVHSMCYDDGHLVAAHTAFPSFYWVGDERVKAYITGDTMVKKKYRDGLTFLDVVRNLNNYMKRNGYAFYFGFPNDHSYPVFKKVKLAKDIGRLDTYILPYRIGGIKKGLKWLNPLSMAFCKIWMLFSCVGLSNEYYLPLIRKDDLTYNPSRYKRLDGNYQHITLDDSEFYYKARVHEGVRTVFLIDVVGKSEKSFHKAIKYILRKEKENIDLLMYVGYLPNTISRIGLIKIPRKFEPKHFYMTGGVFNKSSVYEKVLFNIGNWDVNLSNYDII